MLIYHGNMHTREPQNDQNAVMIVNFPLVIIIIKHFKPEFIIVIFIHYKPRIAIAILDL